MGDGQGKVELEFDVELKTLRVMERPVDWVKRQEDRQVFTSCPMYGECVSVSKVCGACKYFRGLSVPGLVRELVRLQQEEITQGSFDTKAGEHLSNPGAVSVVCNYPRELQCGSFREVR